MHMVHTMAVRLPDVEMHILQICHFRKSLNNDLFEKVGRIKFLVKEASESLGMFLPQYLTSCTLESSCKHMIR